jgi:hypothetical protein
MPINVVGIKSRTGKVFSLMTVIILLDVGDVNAKGESWGSLSFPMNR